MQGSKFHDVVERSSVKAMKEYFQGKGSDIQRYQNEKEPLMLSCLDIYR